MNAEREAAETKPVPTGIELTPLDPTFQRDPQPVLDELRRRAPVHHDEQWKRWVLTRHDDIDPLLRDKSMAMDPRKADPDTFLQMMMMSGERDREPSMLFLDAPEHTRLRSLVNKAFTPRAVEKIRPRIQEIADELLAKVAGGADFDLIASLAAPLPVIVIAEMLGVDSADWDDFKRWTDESVMAFNPFLDDDERQRVMAASQSMEDYFRRTIAERRESPREDLISSLIAVEEAGDQLTDDEIVTMCALLLGAGNVTTTDLIGNGVLALLQHPDEMEKLRANPDLIVNAVEEMLRYDSPVTQTARITMSEREIGGCPIAARQPVLMSLAAANHDPAAYPEPHRFDITREDTHHHSFGGGAHFCLGAPLARVEAQVAIGTLVRLFPRLRLVDEPLEWRRIPAFRGLVKLPVLI